METTSKNTSLSHGKNIVWNLARKYNLSIPLKKPSFIKMKKNNKVSMTVISGPHVHNKSRKQYTIYTYTSVLPIQISCPLSLDNFFLFKQHLINEFNSLNNDSVFLT